MKKYKKSIDEIINKMGYTNSSNLIYYNNLEEGIFSYHTNRTLKELQPYAIYSIKKEPFILFFQEENNFEKFKEINRKIWNAQIPIVIFCDESTIRVINGTSLNLDTLLLEVIDEENIYSNSNQEFSYWNISNQVFWAEYKKKYSNNNLNKLLLENIKTITSKLKNNFKISFATKLVLRLIFIRFLIDRGVDIDYSGFSNNIKASKKEFLNVVKDKKALYSLFKHLKEKFNGNLFDLDDEGNYEELNQEIFSLLSDFLSGKMCLENGQLSLFEMYDFNIIPVELVSNIYEILLGKKTQKDDKAFYTPNYLVEYTLEETLSTVTECKKIFTVLDPSCGSGIFLVQCYRRMIEINMRENDNIFDDNLLIDILSNNIFGVDINEEAIDVTIFSLYLTVLDYKDPKSLYKFKLPDLKNKNLIVGDFFDNIKLKKLENISFDFIVGNPPWGSIKDGMHMRYCKEKKKPQQNSEISRSFVYKVEEYCNNNTIVSLILPSKLLYNKKTPAQDFRKWLLSQANIQKIIELSSVRKLVFKHADAPAFIMIYKFNNKKVLDNKFTYISLKPNLFFKLFNIIAIEKDDIKYVKQSMLYDNDWAWKTLVYGTSWDIKFIKRLKSEYPTIDEVLNKNSSNIVRGSGIESQDGAKLDAKHLLGLPLLDSKTGISHFYINSDKSTIFDKERIHRPREKELFEPPYCLITKGVNCDNYKMRAAYSEKQFICKTAIYIIKSNKENKKFLLNLVGLFNSSFYAYLNLMLGSSIGIEREQRFIDEVLQFPYVYDDEIVNNVESINELMLSKSNINNTIIENQVLKLDKIILNRFRALKNNFVNYVLDVQIPIIANGKNSNVERIVSKKEMREYSNIFIKYFQNIFSEENQYIKSNIYMNVMNSFTIFELVISEDDPIEQVNFMEKVNFGKEFLTRFSLYKFNDLFFKIRDVIYFEENSFFIIKTNEYKNWHLAMAEMDLADVIDQIFESNGGDL